MTIVIVTRLICYFYDYFLFNFHGYFSYIIFALTSKMCPRELYVFVFITLTCFLLFQYLNKALGEDLVDIYHGDVLKFDMTNIFPEHLITPWDGEHPNIHIIGNLPFNVSTPLVFQWIRDISMRSGAWRYGRVPMTLTFQHEVAERMVAPIMNKQRSRMSIITQNWCDLRFDYSINGKAFVPPPDVNVGVVCFEPRNEPIVDVSYEHLNKVVRNIFHYRQKYVHRGAW